MNVIDSIVVDDTVAGAQVEGGIEKIRTSILSVYNPSSSTVLELPSGDGSHVTAVKPMPTYTPQTETGYEGLEPAFE